MGTDGGMEGGDGLGREDFAGGFKGGRMKYEYRWNERLRRKAYLAKPQPSIS